MTPSDVEDMLERHSRVAPLEVQAVRAALRTGGCTVCEPQGSGPASGNELLHTYRLRARHLSQFGTEHARTLQRDAEQLCERLTAAGDVRCRWWSFELDHGRNLQFIEDAATGELLGLLHAVTRLKVTAEEWATLWGIGTQTSGEGAP